MIDSSGNNLVFLLCTPRSGSSLATVMLQNHSKIFATQEMWFLMSLYDLKLSPSRPYGGTGIIKQFFNGVVPDDTYIRACRAFALQVYNGLLRSSGSEMVIDKSPRYYYLLELLDSMFPRSKRIWLIRNPLSVISSYKKVNRHVKERFDLKADLLNPKFNIKMADITAGLFRYADYFANGHPYAYRLYYERLVANAPEEMERLCGFLGLEFEEGLEKYGDFMDSAKSNLYFSMGVGDPFVGQHAEPHRESIDSWKEMLDKREVEMYCRALGARLFHDLGYSDALDEAQKMTGVTFEPEPDTALLQLRTKQMAELTGCRWEANYRMRTDETAVRDIVLAMSETDEIKEVVEPQVLQLQITLRSLEHRLEKSYAERKRLTAQLEAASNKINRIKSLIPFGSRLSSWASAYLTGGKKR